ncbi:hypothetical protein M3N64_00225 [Sporolactobacillus sp. CPB3-1]|uniref:Regulatory protein YycH-like domain-containing protein n=1 Tax=Sporolactobacillus mangiferae TaxID=2940498 RepID=A0ABT0M6B7_9BACL|nr:hypothetical protein [Sporolactobacillus mangiferae]MCL1630382.1 hypothetical protein [Sporolactobacillus mangiferae]
MYRKNLFISLLIIAVALFTLMLPFLLSDRAAITYFPDNPRIRFTKSDTHLSIMTDEQLLHLSVQSQTIETNQLIQNFSLLYRNNRLIAILNHWQRNTNQLISARDARIRSGFYNALTVHQAELHINSDIYGKERLSQDYLIVSASGRHAFRHPKTPDEANQLSSHTRQIDLERKQLLGRAAAHYHFSPDHYRIVSLDMLTDESKTRIFPFFNEKTVERIVGQLWEGLYKNFIRGIQLTEGQSESPLGSTVPLLLIADDHMLVIIESSDHHLIMLKQNFT